MNSFAATTSVILGLPSVRVPVLSITTAWIFETCSSVGASLIKILCLAPKPVPTATAVGVAKPRASGQAITMVEIAKVRANSSGWPKMKNQTAKVSNPPPTATMTKYLANRSAIFCPGALEFWAVSTIFTIWASAVSSPILVALNLTDPEVLIEPPITLSPALLATGRDSPVTRDSSIAVSPSTISPSTGTLSPGRNTTISS